VTSAAKILAGEVNRQGVICSLEGGEEILFQKTRGSARPEDKANAILVVVEPEQSPGEVAEIILWALQKHRRILLLLLHSETQKTPAF
jgi:hypothetical protein